MIEVAAIPQASLKTRDLNAYYGDHRAIADVTLGFQPLSVTALIGPSGCGKTTLLRTLNRIHEIIPNARVTGEVILDGENVYDPAVDPIALRRRIGMVFQRPNPFPTLSIEDNVAAGLNLRLRRTQRQEIVERALRDVGLWDEIKDRLRASPHTLSGGQAQRLCIARALAVEPEVLLMDEPTSALDPISAANVEELVGRLASRYTIVVVTHNMQQAARVSRATAFMLADESGSGRVVEYGETSQIFFHPRERRTEDYISGRFG
ncbi:MAG TPA: phosphate ABC transporter ATP-binding protein PstB [Candidatus Rubrimentiphilum sp.]|nr:phosphate ABC transporter ATP-binding protein PstB [Candidatus Rubrimentiphilum sp.]